MIFKVLSIVFPVFALSGIGYLYGRYKRPDMTQINQLNMNIFVPALVFVSLASKSFDLTLYQDLALAGTAIIIGSGILAWPFIYFLKVDYKTFIPPMMFNNSGNMGLPLALLAFGEQAIPIAVILFVIEMVLHFTIGIYMIDHRFSLLRLLRMPMIIATILGLSISSFDITLWQPFIVMMTMLGDVAIPLLLFALGVRLVNVSYKDWHLGVAAAILAPATGLVIVWLVSFFIQLPQLQQSYLIIFAALPPAVLNYLVAEQYNQEPDKVASIVMLANLGAVIVMPFVLGYALF